MRATFLSSSKTQIVMEAREANKKKEVRRATLPQFSNKEKSMLKYRRMSECLHCSQANKQLAIVVELADTRFLLVLCTR